MKYSELFEPEPEKWGLRGDPYLWRELKEHFGDNELPDDESKLYLSIFRYCGDRCKVGLNNAETAYVKDFDKGGMSSGEVSCKWWRETGIPLLLKRANYKKPEIAYDFFYVFYKTTDTPGWGIAFVTVGPNNSIENIIKHKRKWIETKTFCGTKTDKYYSPLFPMILSPCEMHKYSSWIYCLESHKYFLPDDIIPYPDSNAKQKDFTYEILLKDKSDERVEKFNEELDIEYVYKKDTKRTNCLSFVAALKINNSVKIHIEFCDCYYEMFANMYNELNTKKYTFITLSNWEYYKFLFWDNGKTIRFKIQDYNLKTQVEEPVDIEMPKDKFFKVFNKMLCELQKNLDAFKKKYNLCTETIGTIDYSKLNYEICCSYPKNIKYINHDNEFVNNEHKSIHFSLLMDPNYKAKEKESEKLFTNTENEDDSSKNHYYLDDDDETIWAVIDGKTHIFNYQEMKFIPVNRGIDLMKWHEFPETELQKRLMESIVAFGFKNKGNQ